MWLASNTSVSIIAVLDDWPYYWVSVLCSLLCMVWGSSRVSAFEFATMNMLRLYFVCFVYRVVGVCGIVANFFDVVGV